MPLKALVPRGIKSSIKGVLQRRWLKSSLAALERNGKLTEDELERFYRGWGNEGFAADKNFLRTLLAFLDKGPVLECGTGATTLLESVMGRRNGFKTYCLEQDPEWTRPAVEALGASESVMILDTPLKNYGTHLWYDVRTPVPNHFALVVCDGPYIEKAQGEPYYSAWRYGVLPWLKSTRRTWDVLLLDDVEDAKCPGMLARWEREFPISVQRIKSTDGELAMITSTQAIDRR